MALQFHPDKNNAPGAGEAFKAIGNAFAVRKSLTYFSVWKFDHFTLMHKIFRENNLHFYFRPKSDFTDSRQYIIAINSVKLTFY